MRTIRIMGVVVLVAVVAACSQYGSTTAPSGLASSASLGKVDGQGPNNSRLSAVMQFGKANVGSPFPPGSEHDQSAHAVDDIVPRTVVIDVGGTVTFNVPAAVHQIRIYNPGTSPEDINTAPGTLQSLNAYAGCPNAPPIGAFVFVPIVITDATNLKESIPIPCITPTTVVSQTFDTPGRYLVICAFLPHFNVGMYGWIEVKARPA